VKKYSLLICTIVLTVTACNRTQTPAALSDATSTPRASQTHAPFTSTITPLPTIPTFTPTFNATTIVTATPAEKAECPKENPNVLIDFLIPQKIEDILDPSLIDEEKVLSYLNNGGSIFQLIDRLKTGYMDKKFIYQDFTQDGLNELLIKFHTRHGHSYYSIFTCINSAYKSFDPIDNFGALGSQAYVLTIEDMNKNGIPEIVVADGGSYFIIEWSGSNFKNIAYDSSNNQWPTIHSPSEQGKIEDVNRDGLKDLILTGADIYYYGFNESYYEGLPWRDEIRVYVWNGDLYSQLPSEYSEPEYRFQAVQDGDRETIQRNYEQALTLYQSAISSDKLSEWSVEMRASQDEIPKSNYLGQPTPTFPAPDMTEYPRLAAYAYYRIMIIQFAQGQESKAIDTYNTLQNTFGSDLYGSPYVVMATSFWNAYQANQKMYDGCATAIQYAVEHPEILIPLGSDYHGAQSHIYVPSDVCPFR
jgi:tetratricopeptide (TPR) repeat protein